MPALCSVLGTGDDEPVSIEVLKALYTIIAPDGSGEMRQRYGKRATFVWSLLPVRYQHPAFPKTIYCASLFIMFEVSVILSS